MTIATSGSGIMVPMTITITITITITAISEQAGVVYATVSVSAESIGASAQISLQFEKPPDTKAEDWHEYAYDRALMMLDPA